MAGGYDMTPVDPLDVLRAQLVDLKARVSELERPTGTQIAEVVRSTVHPAVGNGVGSGFVLTTSYVSRAACLIPIPDGYSRALISASGFVTGTTGASGGDFVFARARVNGVSGTESPGLISVYMAGASVSAFATASLEGLSGGVVTVDVEARLNYGPGSNVFAPYNLATISAQALFLR